MLIRSKGINIESFTLPPFDLNAGEIVVLYLYSGAHFWETAMFLKDIFTGKTYDENVVVNQKLTYVERFHESKIRNTFWPVTIAEYLKSHANLDSPYTSKIFEISGINKKTKVKSLDISAMELLTMYAALSKSEYIVFDLLGKGPEPASKMYDVVSDVAKKGGAAILLDNCPDLKDSCDKYVELRWNH